MWRQEGIAALESGTVDAVASDALLLIGGLVGLVVYIGLGIVTLRRGRTAATRISAAIAALLTLACIVSVALSKSAWGPLTGWT